MHPATDKRVHYKEAVSLVRAGHTVTHVCPDPAGDRLLDGVRIVTFSGKRSIAGRLSCLATLYRLAVAQDADVYHCNEVDSWMAGVWLKIRHGKKLVFDSHEIPSHDFAESRVPRLLQPIVVLCFRLLFRLMLLFTDRLVLAKRSADMDFRHTHVPKTLVQNFADVVEKDDHRQSASNDDTVTLVHLGAINRQRGWPQMLEALARTETRALHLEVIGQFGDGSEKDFLARVKDLGLEDRGTFTPWIAYDAVPAALARCDIGIILFQPVMFNFTHALPHKLFDYMLARLPVIAPGFAVEVAEIIHDSDAGLLVDPTNISQVAAAMDKLATDPMLRQRYGDNGRRAVMETYNWPQEERKLIAMYETMETAA